MSQAAFAYGRTKRVDRCGEMALRSWLKRRDDRIVTPAWTPARKALDFIRKPFEWTHARRRTAPQGRLTVRVPLMEIPLLGAALSNDMRVESVAA